MVKTIPEKGLDQQNLLSAFDALASTYTEGGRYSRTSTISMHGLTNGGMGIGRYTMARDEDGDGFHEIHVNTMEGFWSWLRSWLRPHHGISQEKLPLYLGFFEFVHNVRKRGKALLSSLVHLVRP